MSRFRSPIAAAVLMVFASFSVNAASGPSVAVSILPLHSLVSSVMAGVSEPTLLIPRQVSPHRYSLRPSQVRAISKADIVFWTEPTFLPYLSKAARGSKAKLVSLGKFSGVTRYKAREGGVWEGHDHSDHGKGHDKHGDHSDHGKGHDKHGDHSDHGKGHDKHGTHGDIESHMDQHTWLDPLNALAMAEGIVRTLISVDPANASRYKSNGAYLRKTLTALVKRIDGEVSLVRGKSFIVFHDAYQYFEKRFKIPASGSVLAHSGQAPSAKRLYQIRKKILSKNTVCVFREPQFDSKLAKSLVDGTGAKIGTIDPIGVSLKPGPSAYPLLIQNLASSLVDCLKAG